jgi:MFS family permease
LFFRCSAFGKNVEPASAKTALVHSDNLPQGQSYLEWGAVWGGSVVAIATSTVLGQFGGTAGLALGEPVMANGEPSWQVVVASLWLFLTTLASLAAGGYIAGRMRSRWGDAAKTEVEFRDGVHGLSVWAVSTLAVAAVAAFGAALAGLGMDTTAADEVPANVTEYVKTLTVVYGFAAGAAAALGAGAAWWFASLGGSHRDEATDVNLLTPRFLRR